MSFEELGKKLDKLVGPENAKLAMQLIENFAHPLREVKVNSQINWINVFPNTPREAVKLDKNNAQSIIDWMVETAGFDFAEPIPEGISTDCGEVHWNEWIVLEDYEAVVFYDEEQFNNHYLIQ